jgi:hypothetical protein
VLWCIHIDSCPGRKGEPGQSENSEIEKLVPSANRPRPRSGASERNVRVPTMARAHQAIHGELAGRKGCEAAPKVDPLLEKDNALV